MNLYTPIIKISTTFHRPITKVTESIYLPLFLSNIGSYGLNHLSQKNHKETNHKEAIKQKTEDNIHLKATKVFAYSAAADHLCAPFKLNFATKALCNFAMKEAISYGVQTLYDNYNSQELYNNDAKLSSQEE